MKWRVFIIALFCSISLVGQEYISYASYYHDKHHGMKTASGVTYNRDSLTCAHKTLPFGTKLLVTNLSNNKQVIVTVNDRGPFIKGREVDLSYRAALSIGIISKGVQKIRYSIIK